MELGILMSGIHIRQKGFFLVSIINILMITSHSCC